MQTSPDIVRYLRDVIFHFEGRAKQRIRVNDTQSHRGALSTALVWRHGPLQAPWPVCVSLSLIKPGGTDGLGVLEPWLGKVM